MFQKYYSDNTTSKFIKELLRTTYIPTVPIWKPGDIPIKGLTYITKDSIVKCVEDYKESSIDSNMLCGKVDITEIPDTSSKGNFLNKYFILKIKTKVDILPAITITYKFIQTSSNKLTTLLGGYIYLENGSRTRTQRFSIPLGTIKQVTLNGVEISSENLNNLVGWEFTHSTANHYTGDPRIFTPINSIYENDRFNKPYFKILQPYIKGEYYRGITTNYISESSLYDPKTHYYLGEYLRFIRDFDGINLMQYYNCWDGRYTDRLDIVESDGKYYINKLNDNLYNGYKTLIVPIKPNMDYTIYIDSSIPYEICSLYYDGVNVLTPRENSYYTLFNHIKVSYSSFNQPFTYRVDKSSTESLGQVNTNYTILQNQLVMLIKIPEINTLSIVVLEGNYLGNKSLLLNGTYLSEYQLGSVIANYKTEQGILNKYFSSTPKLLKVVDGGNYAFDDRLIEYLSLNAITDKDYIADNIKRVQEYISSSKCLNNNGVRYTKNYIPGIWDINMRAFIYELVTSSTNKFRVLENINGYVDKDTESILLRGK